MNWQGRRTLVTGATGMVGSWMVKRLLAEGAEVVALVRDWNPHSELIRSGDINRINVINGSLEEYAALDRAINKHEVDTVFHLGAQTIVGTALRSPYQTFEANIRGTYNLLEVCRLQSSMVKSIVIASSDKAYGDVEVLPYNEEMPMNGRHPYDVSKSCTDLLAATYAHTYGLPITIARCGNIYGGGDLNWSRIVPGTILSVVKNESLLIRSDGTFLRDYIYVLDVVEAYMLLASRANDDGVRGEGFNFSCEEPMNVLDISAKVKELMGRPDLEPTILNQAKAEIRDQYLDSRKAREVLDWAPRYGTEEGLRQTIGWYLEFLKVDTVSA
jgi:CDP-glucose 4,6-dehydratase